MSFWLCTARRARTEASPCRCHRDWNTSPPGTTITHTQSQSHTQSHRHTIAHNRTQSHTQSHNHTHTQSHTIAHTHTHTQSHTHNHTRAPTSRSRALRVPAAVAGRACRLGTSSACLPEILRKPVPAALGKESACAPYGQFSKVQSGRIGPARGRYERSKGMLK